MTQGISIEPGPISSIIILSGWLLGVLLLTAFYTSNLMAMFVIANDIKQPESLTAVLRSVRNHC